MATQRGWSHESNLGAVDSRPVLERNRILFALFAIGFSCFDVRADNVSPAESVITASNQQLTLEMTDAAESATRNPAATNAEAGRLPVEAVESSTVPAQKRRLQPTAAKPKKSLADALRSDASATPWYRSGLGATTIVLGLVFVLYLGVRRCLPGVVAPETSALRVAARVALSPRHSLALVRVGRRYLVLGMSPDHVSAVCDIHETEEVAELTAQFGIGRAKSSRFADLVASESMIFSGKSADLGADGQRLVVEQTDDSRNRDPWTTLADLRRRIRSLRNRGADAKAVA